MSSQYLCIFTVSFCSTLTVDDWEKVQMPTLHILETQQVSIEETGCHAKYVKHFKQIKQDTKGTFEPAGVQIRHITYGNKYRRCSHPCPNTLVYTVCTQCSPTSL